ncbi:MAG: glycoside hydrolase family 3 C-terminal domain-containing protein, partial [Bacteroidales bacterium]|nr:glycoside hydrolase family 3 C-terminal domain-containing protein [Bacteroidales bacterium]
MNSFEPFSSPVKFEQADSAALLLLSKMTLEEKISMLGGHNMFYTQGIDRLGIPALLMSDATAGVRMLDHIKGKIGKSTAFPCPVALAATWNPEIAYQYARSIGEECNAAGIHILLGPGVNIYRISQNGRNFEYFGEDPYLGSRMVEQYIKGVQSTGTIATLKHFLCNNHEYHRRTTNVLVDDRTLHEIYLPIFKAGIDAGAMAVMTAYNQVRGEYCGQSKFVISDLLRKELGFKWLVMSDWWSTFDPEKTIKSGLDLEMPGESNGSDAVNALGDVYVKTNAKRLLEEGKITLDDIDRMVRSFLRTAIAMKLFDKKADSSYLIKFTEHEQTALNTAREAVVLLKNNGILPLSETTKVIITGHHANIVPAGQGSAYVEGYNKITLVQAMAQIFGNNALYIEKPSAEELKKAKAVVLNIGTADSEGYDRPFDLPEDVEKMILYIVENNPNTIVVVNSGGGINMTRWIDKVAAVLYAFYPGQNGNIAIAEILSGKINPSGKLPFTIEKNFSDAPGKDYIPIGQQMEHNWNNDLNIKLPINTVTYHEGILVGYRWYETKNIEPLFWFGHGLSYTSFAFRDIKCTRTSSSDNPQVEVSFEIENTGKISGAEVAQLYVEDVRSSVVRPKKELKAFQKVFLTPGEKKTVRFTLGKDAFAFYDATRKTWVVEP